MRVLIPGGSGLVGRALTEELASRGHDCVVLSRSPKAASERVGSVRIEAWDGTSPEALRPLLEGVDAVVNLIGESIGDGRWSAARKRRILESRTESTRAVAAAMVEADKPSMVLIQASAVGIYGPRDDQEISEGDSVGDDFLARVCRDWEAASESVVEAGIRRVVARTGVVLSASGGALPKMVLPFRLFAGGPLGSGNQFVPWIHIVDEAAALRFLLERQDIDGPINLVAPGAVTNRQLARVIGETLGRPSRLPTPAFALRAMLGEMSTLLLEGQRVVPGRLLEAGFQFQFPELDRALKDLLAAGPG